MRTIKTILGFLSQLLGVVIIAPTIGLLAWMLVSFPLLYFEVDSRWAIGVGGVVAFFAYICTEHFFIELDFNASDGSNNQVASSGNPSPRHSIPTAPNLPRPAGTFKFFCPCCGNRIESPHDQIGTRANCPHCSGQIVVPDSALG